MEASNPVERLLSEVRLLSYEDREQLIYRLITEKQLEDRTPDKVEELPDGTRRETFVVRPEERRGKTIEGHDLFMGHLKVVYRPPANREYIRLGLEHATRIPRRYFRPPPPDVLNNFFPIEMSRKSAEEFVSQLANKRGISPQTFITFVNKTIEALTEKLFWELGSRYDSAVREVQSNLMHEIEISLCKKIGIPIKFVQKKGDITVIEELRGPVIEKKIENPKHRPKKSQQDQEQTNEEFKQIVTWILIDLLSSGKPAEEITLPLLCNKLIPVIGEIGEPALRARLRNCGIKNWPEFRNSLVSA